MTADNEKENDMFIRIPGDRCERADYAAQAESFPSLAAALDGLETKVGPFDTFTVLDATEHPVRVVATVTGFTLLSDAEKAMLAAVVGHASPSTGNAFETRSGAAMTWLAG